MYGIKPDNLKKTRKNRHTLVSSNLSAKRGCTSKPKGEKKGEKKESRKLEDNERSSIDPPVHPTPKHQLQTNSSALLLRLLLILLFAAFVRLFSSLRVHCCYYSVRCFCSLILFSTRTRTGVGHRKGVPNEPYSPFTTKQSKNRLTLILSN